jgi:hypothetical protein
MKALRILLLAGLMAGGCRPKDAVAHFPPEVVPGKPPEIYERGLPVIKQRLRRGTGVIRTDDADTLMMRFSLSGGDKTLRLVDVSLQLKGTANTEIKVQSKKFAFILTARRDEIDRAVEAEILSLLRGPGQLPDPAGAEKHVRP